MESSEQPGRRRPDRRQGNNPHRSDPPRPAAPLETLASAAGRSPRGNLPSPPARQAHVPRVRLPHQQALARPPHWPSLPGPLPRVREFHGAPPMLGFLYSRSRDCEPEERYRVPRFVYTPRNSLPVFPTTTMGTWGARNMLCWTAAMAAFSLRIVMHPCRLSFGTP